ncbi:hypothetical protein H1R20_g12045, partial [Candolleomyces eurysporus]
MEERVNFFRDLRVQELGEKTQMTNEAWVRSLYLNLFETSDIEKYMESSSEYRDGRWVRMPECATLESDLCEPLCTIINSVVEHLGASGTKDAREAVATKTTAFKCPTIGSSKPASSPNIVVRASGPSFLLPKDSPLGFSNSSMCMSTKLEAELMDDLDQLAEMTFFAKQMFIKQPNRFFVRSLIVTENHARLFHFDRSGAQYTPFFNIHKEAATFIRLILGLCSLDEHVLGLDNTVQWTIGADGRRSGGTLKTIGPDKAVVTFELLTEEEPFTRSSVRGRGTTCWPVRNAQGDRFIVKDHWVSGSRTPEFELLKEVVGLKGVCQMVSYEDNRAQTKDFRGDTGAFQDGAFHNRTAIRIVMKAYGPPIERFSTVEQFLAALRDAIAGHRALLAKNILHRDVSPNNILVGPPEAHEGERGVVIDLDIALRLGSNTPSADNRADFKIGTRMFQSVMVLMTYRLQQQEISAHDYLDDLEGFFWVFSYIIIVYKSNGERASKSDLRHDLSSWQQEGSRAFNSKYTFLHSTSKTREVVQAAGEGWDHTCLDLFAQFKDYMSGLAKRKERLVAHAPRESDPVAIPNLFSPLLEELDEHYNHILALFDDALEKVKGSPQLVNDRVKNLSSTPKPSLSTPIALPSKAVLAADQYHPLAPSQVTPLSSSSDPSALTLPSTPSETYSLAQPSTPSRSPKRRFDDAELDDSDPPDGEEALLSTKSTTTQCCCGSYFASYQFSVRVLY